MPATVFGTDATSWALTYTDVELPPGWQRLWAGTLPPQIGTPGMAFCVIDRICPVVVSMAIVQMPICSTVPVRPSESEYLPSTVTPGILAATSRSALLNAGDSGSRVIRFQMLWKRWTRSSAGLRCPC